MGSRIPVAHDFNCPWCWIGLFQARRLRREAGVEIDWRPFELYPDELELPGDPPPRPTIPNRPETPRRIDLALAAAGLEPIDLRLDSAVRTHRAHEAAEFAREEGVQDALVERIYRAYWKEGRDIDSLDVLTDLATGIVSDVEGMRRAIEERRYDDRIVKFNKPAYAEGVFNVPTFWIGGERYAEQPYAVLAAALLVEPRPAPYATLDFPPPPADRPYVLINMVSTIDGKTVTAGRDAGVMDLGSKIDHQAMRNIEDAVEAVMIGAQTLRATPKVRFDPKLFRIVATRSGKIDPTVRFFTDAPNRALVATPAEARLAAEGVRHWPGGEGSIDFAALLAWLRAELGITRLLVEGGSELNAAILENDLADELFLTVAPKVRLGRELPTYAGGRPLPDGATLGFDLISEQRVGDELFLRYRRRRTG